MFNRFSAVVIACLLIADVLFVVQIRSLKRQIGDQATKQSGGEFPRQLGAADSTQFVFGDLFGAYTYAGFGAWLAPEDANGKRIRSPFTLNVFLSSKTECPGLLGEMEILRRLEPVLSARGQRMIAVCDGDDSAGVASVLEQQRLSIPLLPLAFEDSSRLAFLGISPYSMPFKVIYDSTFSAIYVRGADNTPESQADFERAVLRLSSLVQRGKL